MTAATRSLTQEEIETYRRDGVVCLRGVLSDEWVEVVKDAVDDAERRYRDSPGRLPGNGRPEPTLERSNLHPLSNFGDQLEAQGVEILRDGDADRDDASRGAADDKGQFILVNNAMLDYPAVQRLALESPLGELAAQLFASDKVSFLFDQIFIKQAGADTRTAFHQDWGYFHVFGEQVASFWTAAEAVTRETGSMGYVRDPLESEVYPKVWPRS